MKSAVFVSLLSWLLPSSASSSLFASACLSCGIRRRRRQRRRRCRRCSVGSGFGVAVVSWFVLSLERAVVGTSFVRGGFRFPK